MIVILMTPTLAQSAGGIPAAEALHVGVVGMVPVLLVRAFPAAIRYSGVSFSYNVAYAISGGLTPLIVTLWLRSHPHAPAYYVGVVALVAVLTVISNSTASQPMTLSSRTQ